MRATIVIAALFATVAAGAAPAETSYASNAKMVGGRWVTPDDVRKSSKQVEVGDRGAMLGASLARRGGSSLSRRIGGGDATADQMAGTPDADLSYERRLRLIMGK